MYSNITNAKRDVEINIIAEGRALVPGKKELKYPSIAPPLSCIKLYKLPVHPAIEPKGSKALEKVFGQINVEPNKNMNIEILIEDIVWPRN